MNRFTTTLVAGTAALTLTGCFGSDRDAADFYIPATANASQAASDAFDQVKSGQVIEFGCGWFEIDTDLSYNGIDGVTIRGCGKDETVLSFADSPTGNGILAENVEGVLIQGLTVVDTPADGIRVENGDNVTMRDVRAIWSGLNKEIDASNWQTAIKVQCPTYGYNPGHPAAYVTNPGSGKYGLYPTDSRDVLMEDSESIGAWDAGIYIGQSEDVILRNNRSAFNVAGIEIENTNRADAYNNISECNTAGLMVFNLPGRPFYGDQVRVFDNILRNNNTENFASSGFITLLPPGLGLMVMALDQVEARDNIIEDNDTAGVIIVSHELLAFAGETAGMADLQLNPWPDAIHIRNNTFSNNGNNPADGDALSLVITAANEDQGGAHIIWDGFIDEYDGACAAPTEVDSFDDRGKPQYRNDPEPACRYNAYKFDGAGERIKPDFWICVEENNFGAQDAPAFLNVMNSLDDTFTPIGADNDPSPHDCTAEFGETLPLLPAANPNYF